MAYVPGMSTTKSLLQIMRDRWCDAIFENVKLFCDIHGIDIPEMSDRYRAGRGRSRDPITIEHHCIIDIYLLQQLILS